MKRKVCVVTATRAEYGLLSGLIKEINNDKELELQIIATGMHLSEKYGLTYTEIEDSGFKINKKIDLKIDKDDSSGVAKSMSIAIEEFTNAFNGLKPDIVVLLGDRYEILSVAIACMISKIPIAHIHGGETTEGAFDEAIRHSITKMSHLHFTSCEEYKKRVVQLGEQPDRVFNTGALGVENIKKITFLEKTELEKQINFKFNERNLLITFHPVTLESKTSKEQFKELLEALNGLEKTNFIFTKPNSDPDNLKISEMIDEFVRENRDKAIAFNSMGLLKYLSTMQFVDAVVGNSSSGIAEAPSFQIGTINIGDRQKGRIQAKSIINCTSDRSDIKRAFEILYSDEFQKNLKKVKNLYEQENTSVKIKDVIKSFKLDNILKKTFYNYG